MRPVARRFRLEIAGRVVVGLAFDGGDAEMEAWLCAREVMIIDAPLAQVPASPVNDAGTRGQPSAKSMVAAAFASLAVDDFRGCTTATAVADRVRARVATMVGRSLSTRCVRDHLGIAADAMLVQVSADGKIYGKNSGAAINAASRGEQ